MPSTKARGPSLFAQAVLKYDFPFHTVAGSIFSGIISWLSIAYIQPYYLVFIGQLLMMLEQSSKWL
jgi:hypothetical protein